MYKFFTVCLFALLACAAAKPHLIAPVSYAAPVAAVAAPVAAPAYYGAYASPYYAPYASYSPYAPYATYPYAGATYFVRR